MSRVTRLKHVKREIDTDDFSLPTEKQQICRIVSSKGNNLHEVESANEENFLVSMPTKFRKNVWIKRGDYVLVDPIEEGDKVKAEISRILTQEHQKEFEKNFVWPKKFTKKREHVEVLENRISDEENADDDLPQNPNRRHNNLRADTPSSDEGSSDDDEG